ncbi:hypothetical protein BFF94_024075 [Burkholderia catarinensis]|nr:hypothetical protein BFF94_024075 [Burkholderia catarinensis]
MRFRRRAVAGAGGIDAASLGFGRQTKHPARRQAPLPHVQHCAGDDVAQPRQTVRDGLPVERDSDSPISGHRAADGPYRGATYRACPPCASVARLLTSFKRLIGWPCNVVACASARSLSRRQNDRFAPNPGARRSANPGRPRKAWNPSKR